MTKTTNTNPFVFNDEQNNAKSEARKLDYTPVLLDKANSRAHELMLNQHKEKPELTNMVQKVLNDLEPTDLVDLLTEYFGAETIKADSQILDGCDDNQLARLLESRRSDRSKAKKKDPKKSMTVCKTYISAMYAELLIREQTGKPYSGSQSGTEIDIDGLKEDVEAVNRKIRSLQSKKSRLSKIAKYDEAAKAELEQIEDDIARLQSLRPSSGVTAKTVVKSLKVDELRAALLDIDTDTLDVEQKEKLQKLLAKLS